MDGSEKNSLEKKLICGRVESATGTSLAWRICAKIFRALTDHLNRRKAFFFVHQTATVIMWWLRGSLVALCILGEKCCICICVGVIREGGERRGREGRIESGMKGGKRESRREEWKEGAWEM